MSKETLKRLVSTICKVNGTYNIYGANHYVETLAQAIIDAGFIHKDDIEVVIGELIGYTEHENRCLCSQWREGKPTDEKGYDGYKTLYGYGKQEKWYGRNEFPECFCGLNEAIASSKDIVKIRTSGVGT